MPQTAQSTCPICSGSGWKSAAGSRVSRCDCVLATRSGRLLTNARIPTRYDHCDFSEFVALNPTLTAAKLVAEKFVAEYDVTRLNDGLLLVGPIGVGKTHLAVAILKQLIAGKGVAALFYDYRELLKEIQNSWNDSVQTTEMEVLRPVFEAEVLVLDELGAVRPTEWVSDTVHHILNTRYNDKRTTIITTNYRDLPAGASNGRSEAERARAANRDETLGDRIGDRMRSRLHEMCKKVEMDGEDFRQKVRSASFR
jgi:DNA replication protein DnaC